MNKSCAVAHQFWYVTLASSTDRLWHVAQESRFKDAGHLDHSILGNACADEPVLSILQPVATLVFYEQKLFLCIVEVNSLFINSHPVNDIPISMLSDKTAQVAYQALHLVPATYDDDPKGVNDWRLCSLFGLHAKVPGMLIQPINLTVAAHIRCNLFFLFESSALMAMASNLRDCAIHGHCKAIPHIKITDEFPYCEEHGMFLPLLWFIVNLVSTKQGLLCARRT